MTFKRIENRLLRMIAFFILSPLIAWLTISFNIDASEFVEYFKNAWRK